MAQTPQKETAGSTAALRPRTDAPQLSAPGRKQRYERNLGNSGGSRSGLVEHSRQLVWRLHAAAAARVGTPPALPGWQILGNCKRMLPQTQLRCHSFCSLSLSFFIFISFSAHSKLFADRLWHVIFGNPYRQTHLAVLEDARLLPRCSQETALHRDSGPPERAVFCPRSARGLPAACLVVAAPPRHGRERLRSVGLTAATQRWRLRRAMQSVTAALD